MSENIFAYGSNMCSSRFRAYGISPEGCGEAVCLQNFQLRFDKRSRKDGSGKANIESHEESHVWGVLYLVPVHDLLRLDKGEGEGYVRTKKDVCRADGTPVKAWVYVATQADPNELLRPFTWYKRFLIEGAKEHGLPEAYIGMLLDIDANEDPDQLRDEEKRRLECRELRQEDHERN